MRQNAGFFFFSKGHLPIFSLVFFTSFSVSFVMFFVTVITLLYINPYWQQKCYNSIRYCMFLCYYFVSDNLKRLSDYLNRYKSLVPLDIFGSYEDSYSSVFGLNNGYYRSSMYEDAPLHFLFNILYFLLFVSG